MIWKPPYQVHIEKTAYSFSVVLGKHRIITPAMICACYLKDVVSKKHKTIKELEEIFGSEIANYVDELTAMPNQSEVQWVDRMENMSVQAFTIKLAEMIERTIFAEGFISNLLEGKLKTKNNRKATKNITDDVQSVLDIKNKMAEDRICLKHQFNRKQMKRLKTILKKTYELME